MVREHQVLICPACQQTALADLSRCARCGSAHLIRRLDQVECLDCRLVRDAMELELASAPVAAPASVTPPGASPAPGAPSADKPTAADRLPADKPLADQAPAADVAAAADLSSADKPLADQAPADKPPPPADLAAEVARALDRVLGRR